MVKNNKALEAPPWTINMKKYIINQLALWKSYKAIWMDVTGEQFKDKTNLVPLNPDVYHYDMFRMRCARINKNEIALAHEAWQKEIGAVTWAEDKKRIEGMSELIDKITGIINKNLYDKNDTGTLAQLTVALRGVYEQLRKEISADADRAALAASGTKILLTNPKNVAIDVDYLTELIMVYRAEIGGLHNLELDSLTIKELEQLQDKCKSEIKLKIGDADEADFEIIEGDK